MSESLDYEAAMRYPALFNLANKYLDHIEAHEYSEAIQAYMSLFNDHEPTEHEGILHVLPKDEDLCEAAHLCMTYAMMLRQ